MTSKYGHKINFINTSGRKKKDVVLSKEKKNQRYIQS